MYHRKISDAMQQRFVAIKGRGCKPAGCTLQPLRRRKTRHGATLQSSEIGLTRPHPPAHLAWPHEFSEAGQVADGVGPVRTSRRARSRFCVQLRSGAREVPVDGAKLERWRRQQRIVKMRVVCIDHDAITTPLRTPVFKRLRLVGECVNEKVGYS